MAQDANITAHSRLVANITDQLTRKTYLVTEGMYVRTVGVVSGTLADAVSLPGQVAEGIRSGVTTLVDSLTPLS